MRWNMFFETEMALDLIICQVFQKFFTSEMRILILLATGRGLKIFGLFILAGTVRYPSKKVFWVFKPQVKYFKPTKLFSMVPVSLRASRHG